MDELAERAEQCSLSDTGNWTNQNVVFTKALLDMFPLAKTIVEGCTAPRRMPRCPLQTGLRHAEPDRRGSTRNASAQAEQWCDRFEENNRKWLKSTIATCDNGKVELTYEDVDTSLIPPRPRLYGLVGAEVIEEVWQGGAALEQRLQRLRAVALRFDLSGQRLRSRIAIPTTRLREFEITMAATQNGRKTPESFRGSHSAPGWTRATELLGTPSRRVRTGHERDQRAAASRRPAEDVRRQERRAGRLGLQLPGRSLRCLHDGGQRSRAAGLLGAGRSPAGRTARRDRTAAAMSKFPVIRDLMVDRSRLFRALTKVKAWIAVDGYYDMGPGPQQSQADQEQLYPLSQCMSCGCCLEACPQYTQDRTDAAGRRDGRTV